MDRPRPSDAPDPLEPAAAAWGLRAADVEAWRAGAGCRSPAAVARDLVVARFAAAVAAHPQCRAELALRGGVAVHRLTLARPLRCCTSLEYARCSATPIGPVLDALRAAAEATGLRIRTEVRDRPRVYLGPARTPHQRVPRIRVDIETRETQPAFPRVARRLVPPMPAPGVDVLTYRAEELLGLQLRDLYRRSRGRDLFDLWAGLTHLDVDRGAVIAAFRHACSVAGLPPLRRGALVSRLHRHLARPAFVHDVDALVGEGAAGYSARAAAPLLTREILDLLPRRLG